MASSSKPEKVYHVFLSFRGTDVRNNFLGHLYAALDLKGIYTYVDSEELRKGEEIGPALMKAIAKSHMAVIIFSEDYATSSWCLEEAAKIMECREERGLMVFPVFYKVEPREVRTPRDKYRKALDKHESKFGENSEKVKKWKGALSKASNLSGWELKDGDDSEHIQRIVKDIATHLGRTPLRVAKHPVGIDSHVIKLKSMLNLESQDGVLMMGLWGKGGIGKTTLAKAIYNDIFCKFDSSCFLANVRENSKECKNLVTLQEKLLSEILLRKERLVVSSVDAGIELIRERLYHKKVLLVLDDVDDLRQLNALAGEGNWFGNGSRIIVTARDKHLITCHAIDQVPIYEVKALEDREARELLSNHAFLTHQKLEIRRDLVDSALNHAGGLPLALVVLGSFLCGRREDVWESSLKKLSRIPNKTINDVLKISYDGLEENEKEIFLDIACFFKGRDSEYVKEVLNSCELEAVIGLEILIERSLINIEHKHLQMHDLIQSMGMDIVRLECRDDPGRRSRLWMYEDVVDVLSRDMGNCRVKAIVLEPPEQITICANADAFTKMGMLRLLILHNVSFKSRVCLPNEIRCFEWPDAPWYPEFSPGPKKLVRLEMPRCRMTFVPKSLKGFQNLKYMNFSGCQSLVCMPDISCTPNLEELDLHNCKNLIAAHESIACHDKLQVLNLRECSELRVFPDVLESKNLRDLNLERCTKFERFPDIPHELKSLETIDLKGTSIKGLPASIENLVSLWLMCLGECRNLVSLPTSINKLDGLFHLDVENCHQLQEIPELPPFLGHLDATGCEALQNLGDLTSVHDFVRRALNMADSSVREYPDYDITLPGGEMPEWILPVEGDSISFLISQDLCDKFLGIALFVSYDNDGRRWDEGCDIFARVNGRFCEFPSYYNSHEYDRFQLQYRKASKLWKEDDFSQIDGSHAQFSLTVLGIGVKKWGFRIISLPLDDDLRLVFQDNRLINPALIYEVGRESTNLEAKSSLMHKKKDDLKKEIQDNQLVDPAFLCKVGYDSIDSEGESSITREDYSSEADPQEDLQDWSSEADHYELLPLEACEARPFGILIRLAEMSRAMFARCFCC